MVSDEKKLSAALKAGGNIILAAGTYKLPNFNETKTITINGTSGAAIDLKLGAYLENATLTFNNVTILGSTGKANGNGTDDAALYSYNVTYNDCVFEGPFFIGRDGATFNRCTFTKLNNDYVWAYGNDCVFDGCTFDSDGKALLLYSHGADSENGLSKVVVTNCTFNATAGAKSSAIANQNCAAIEIQNFGEGVDLTLLKNTIDSDFSGEWRIKTYHNGNEKIIVNKVEYNQIAVDGKLMNIDGNKNVTFVNNN